MVTIYTNKEIQKLQESGAILSHVLHEVANKACPGVTTFELDAYAEAQIKKAGATPAFLGYRERGEKPYPASLCTSVNQNLVHCIPNKQEVLRAGDIIGLDLGVKHQGLVTDMALSVAVGKISEQAKSLLEVTKQGLEGAIEILKAGITLGDLGYAIQSYAEQAGYSVIRDLVGHGVGHHVHEDPKVPNYGKPGEGMKLLPGMVLAIEPMFALGSPKISSTPDGWGIKMADNKLCAHFEKTVAITNNGCLVLTP